MKMEVWIRFCLTVMILLLEGLVGNQLLCFGGAAANGSGFSPASPSGQVVLQLDWPHT